MNFHVDKVLYQEYFQIVQKIIAKNKLNLYLFLLSNKCILSPIKINKLLVPYYYYKYCSKNMNILKIEYLISHERIFIFVSNSNKIEEYYYLNLFCDTFNLLTPNQKKNLYM